MLVLLDACHSGAATADGSKLSSNADLLRAVMSASNVTVLTSSTSGESSREDERWANGAFTKILLAGLGADADENRDGVHLVERIDSLRCSSGAASDGEFATSGNGPAI